MEAYVTTEYADNFLNKYPGGNAWSELPQAEKESLLLKATIAINSLQSYKQGYNGKKLDGTQFNEFPRDCFDPMPEQVQIACCLEALAMTDREGMERRRLQQQGVSSIAISKSSESYNKIIGLFDMSEYLMSQAALHLIKPFLRRQGVYPIT